LEGQGLCVEQPRETNEAVGLAVVVVVVVGLGGNLRVVDWWYSGSVSVVVVAETAAAAGVAVVEWGPDRDFQNYRSGLDYGK
jgi:hypothetical protein